MDAPNRYLDIRAWFRPWGLNLGRPQSQAAPRVSGDRRKSEIKAGNESNGKDAPVAQSHTDHITGSSESPSPNRETSASEELNDSIERIPTLDEAHQGNDGMLLGNLCQECSKWNEAQYLFRVMRQDMQQPKLLPMKQILDNQQCSGCRIISSSILNKAKLTGRGQLEAQFMDVFVGSAFFVRQHDPYDELLTYRENHEQLAFQNGQTARCVLYIDYHDTRGRDSYDLKEAEGFWCSPKLAIPLRVSYNETLDRLTTLSPWEESRFMDTNLIRTWITTCETQHTECQEARPSLPSGFRLIDTEQMCIIEAPEDAPRFVTLSYVWNQIRKDADRLELRKNTANSFKKPGSIKLDTLPELLKDTVWLCRQLGERFLWFDRLCIVQDDSGSKHSQIAAMDIIYGAAAFTIVAASDGEQCPGLPGVPHRPRSLSLFNDKRLFKAGLQKLDINFHTVVDRSVWNTRGWTYQERLLSPRCLFITDHQVYFTCGELILQEDMGGILQTEGLQYRRPSTLSISNIRQVNTLQTYKECVSDYTSRVLSFDSDRLKAFVGISNAMAGLLQCRMLLGVPERHLLAGLLWESSGFSTRIRDQAPIRSWAWSAWSGAVSFKDSRSDLLALFPFYVVEHGPSLRQMLIDETWLAQASHYPHTLIKLRTDGHAVDPVFEPNDPVTTLKTRFEARSRTDVPPGGLDNLSGCLVFRTTVADLNIRARDRNLQSRSRMLNLHNKRGVQVGWMEMDRVTASQLDYAKTYPFIVICAARTKHKPSSRMASTRRSLASRSLELGKAPLFGLDMVSDRTGSVWVLRVMLIQKINGVAYRMGIGTIQEHLWGVDEPPTWETITLA